MNKSSVSENRVMCGRPADYPEGELNFPLLICSIIALGGILKASIKNSRVLDLLILSVSGFIVGQMAQQFPMVHKLIFPVLNTSSYALYCYFYPIIIFVAALDVDFFILKNVFWQVFLTAFISFSVSVAVIGYVAMKFNKDSWDLQSSIFFSLTLSSIDPLYSVNPLQTIGVSKIYIDIIRGESLFMCSIVAVLFDFFQIIKVHFSEFNELDTFISIVLYIFGSTTCGFVSAKIVQCILMDLLSNTLTNVILCFSMVYVTFYFVEIFRMSGTITLVTIGLNLNSLNFKPNMEFIITKFFMMFSSVYHQLIYTFFGIVIGCGEQSVFHFHTIVFIFIIFVSLNAVRMLTVLLVRPIFFHSKYDYSWRLGIVIAWSGVKGVLNLIWAPEMYNLSETKIRSPEMCILYVQAISLLTLGINPYMMTQSAKTLGLCSISIPRQIAMQNAIGHIKEIIANTITLLKTEKILTNVNWTLVEEKSRIEYIIPFHCSNSEMKEASLTDEELIEEARLHVAIIQMSSFEKQCNDGILNAEAARILIGATKSYCPIQGKFMSIYDVSNYVRSRSWLMKFKNMITVLEYRKEKLPFIPTGNDRLLFFMYPIVLSEEFEYTGYIITLLYIFPMIMHLWPMARELNVSGLILVNYYFVFLYILQATLKILIFKGKYFQLCWNTLEFIILLLGLADVLCIYFVKLRPENSILIQITVLMGYFRIIRFLPIIKVIIPVLINIVDALIKERLSLMYSITKGYVKSQEDAKYLIKQISSRESIYQKLNDILETNRRDAVKELGHIEHEGRDVVIALKSKQAILNVILKAQKNLTFLCSRGIIDKHEGIEIYTVFLKKIKALNNFPMAIPPPTPEKYLHNIIWLENKEVLIEFFRKKAKLAYFDYGDVICKEGEMPQGIYLIISGMAILHSSPPTFGVDSSLKPENISQTMFTEYCTSGDIIGELNCLLKRENDFTAICETILQACFISLEDLYEGFDVFWPSLEYKIWLKLALHIASQYFESSLVDEDLAFQKCVECNHAYVETLSSYNEVVMDPNMKFVILVYGSVIDTKTEKAYFAPSMLAKTCEQIQGTSDLSKLLIILSSESTNHINNTSSLDTTSEKNRMAKKEYRRRTSEDDIFA
ncbi:sodium/hydrogen exchanger 11 [Echinops telfairi]|uniref:Sodium/hydrogen exchanger 11 n=1 Tax=Echinops telfairi TaxID=9371 RepID=A0ABM0ISQ2_ECHTE|nr:sodium/hydrogen exchanger 11 [Echinops telfairi]